MLELQQASAGSGKTYTLAKKYIWYLITIKEDNNPRRLRTKAELADSARHILAVTFTNKATNEMQERIVARLDDLAFRPVWTEDGKTRHADYLDDFTAALGVSAGQVSAVCRSALFILLENYSDFKVSTIDSFFQLVLRTFAYESDLNDAYQVEIDSMLLSKVAVDGMLDILDDNDEGSKQSLYSREDVEILRYWIGKMMSEAGSQWNIFSRDADSISSDAPYKRLLTSLRRLENEEYKGIRPKLEAYFKKKPDMRAIYEALQDDCESPVKDAFRKLTEECRKIYDRLPAETRAVMTASSYLGRFVVALRRYAFPSDKEWTLAPESKAFKYLSDDFASGNSVRPGIGEFANDPGFMAPVSNALQAWAEALDNPSFKLWKVYSVHFPFLALFEMLERKRREFLEEENTIELGETSMILHEIIRDDDAPFVYERLGTELDHFLIDEFQDTSRMQWCNIRPLLLESLGRGKESLIIGDAKQSIYRFRNADSTLISGDIPDMVYGDGIRPAESPSTNFRSELRIVQFNNSFFKYFANRLDNVHPNDENRRKFAPLYGNVIQIPKKAKDKNGNEACGGYVELHIDSGKEVKVGQKVADLIVSLIERGYRQRDIAVLVYMNGEGAAIIEDLIEYNRVHRGQKPTISFVSEESLKIANSQAVRFVLGVLENIARGINPEVRSGDERRRRGVGSWCELEALFKQYVIRHGSGSRARMLEDFVNSNNLSDDVKELLSSMNSFALPALVEMSTTLLPEDVRKSDAVFLAAFQDLVIEYCERFPTDIGSFLQWWNRKGRFKSITSPKDTDAVQIMTLHKSKGLEFKCVIVPFANWETADTVIKNREEWRWVEPLLSAPEGHKLPPFVPVATENILTGTPHESVLTKYYDDVKSDYLNQIYVTFTRAEKELYVLMENKVTAKEIEAMEKGKVDGIIDDPSQYLPFGRYLREFVMQTLAAGDSGDVCLLPPSAINIDSWDDRNISGIIKIGQPSDPENPLNQDDSEDSETESVSGNVRLESYYPSGNQKASLKISQANLSRAIESRIDLLSELESDDLDKFEDYKSQSLSDEPDGEEEFDENYDLDPRSEGNLKHAILENVRLPGDLPRAVRRMVINGMLTPQIADEYLKSLEHNLADPEVARWFDGEARVINEHPVVSGGGYMKRPDRVLVYPDGHAEVVDYKFGKIIKSDKYRQQVRRYVRLLTRTGLFTSVRGYLWYVNESHIEPV